MVPVTHIGMLEGIEEDEEDEATLLLDTLPDINALLDEALLEGKTMVLEVDLDVKVALVRARRFPACGVISNTVRGRTDGVSHLNASTEASSAASHV